MQGLIQVLGGIAGIVLLYYGAEFLVRGGVEVARRFGMPSLLIGLTLVAFATSAPELVVSLEAAWKGSGDISLGNVVGSNICNIGLILGLSALIAPMPVEKSLAKLEMPFLAGASLALCLFFHWNHGVNRWEAAFFLLVFLALQWLSFRKAREKAQTDIADAARGVPENNEGDRRRQSLLVSLLWVVGGVVALVGGAKLLVDFAIYLAKLFGVSDAVIGLTVVAVGTSLPELATSLVAAIRGEQDIAIGNVVGSNLFNILAILGIVPLISPVCGQNITLLDFYMMLGITLLLWGILAFRPRLGRRDGAVFFAAYAAYTGYLIHIA